ncbi:hypothetical protein AB0B97_12040 [Micromonospora sp. NPDC049004]|uniref:hypothetical protein n=1 Tax=Micromonospora sp. NPDC049004 TaxID=3154348 RepID=UPI00340F9973
MVSIGMLATTVTLGGLAVGALLRDGNESTSPGVPIVVSAAASATDVDSHAELAVSLTQANGSVQVRATVTGLQKDVGYRLYGYSLDGTRWPVVNWTGGAGKVQEVTGTAPVAIADVSHFVVLRSDRTTVVTVYLSKSESANLGPNGS